MGAKSSKHKVDDADRILIAGRPNLERCDNKITTYKYTIWSFLPVVSPKLLWYDLSKDL